MVTFEKLLNEVTKPVRRRGRYVHGFDQVPWHDVDSNQRGLIGNLRFLRPP